MHRNQEISDSSKTKDLASDGTIANSVEFT